MKFRIITDHPVAIDSLDHIYPTGSVNDNSTDLNFIEEVENFFGNKKLSILDLGCAGGQLAVDFANRGHDAIGLEGSSKPRELGLYNWPEYQYKILFNCDIGKPFEIYKEFEYPWSDDGTAVSKIDFDLITAWEVLEHLKLYEIAQLFLNLKRMMHKDSLFVGSINWHTAHSKPDPNIVLHRTRFKKDFWVESIIPDYFEVIDYPFKNAVRGADDPRAFLIALKPKWT